MSYWQNVYHFEDTHPPLDEALHTIGTSLTRIATRYLTTLYSSCQVHNLHKLLQVFTYHHNDQFRVILIN